MAQMPNSKARVADSSQAGMLSGVELSARKLESNMTDAWGVKSISWRLVLKYQARAGGCMALVSRLQRGPVGGHNTVV